MGMWREVAVVLKYSSLNLARSRSRRKGKRHSTLTFFVGNLSVAVFFGVMITFALLSSASHQPMEIFNRTIEGTSVSFGELLVSPWLFIGTVIFLASSAPSLVYNVFDSPDLEFLLTLPIHRSSIVLVKNLEILPYYSTGLAMVFPAYILLGYLHANWLGAMLGFIAALVYIVFLWALSSFLASFLSLFMGRVLARRLAMLVYLVSVMFLVVAYNLLVPNLSRGDSMASLLRYARFMTSLLFPYTWFSRAVSGNTLWWVASAVPLIVVYGAARLSLHLEISRPHTHTRRRGFTFKHRPFPYLRKDLIFLRRDPQLLYMLAYPVAFSLIFLIQHEPTIGVFAYVQLTALYAALTVALLLRQEFLVWPVPLVFPARSRHLVLPKILIPSVAYSATYAIVVSMMAIVAVVENQTLLSIPLVFLIVLSSTLFGAWLFLRKPNRPVRGRRVFTLPEFLVIQGLTFLWAFSTIGIVQLGFVHGHPLLWTLVVASVVSMIVFVVKVPSKMKIVDALNP